MLLLADDRERGKHLAAYPREGCSSDVLYLRYDKAIESELTMQHKVIGKRDSRKGIVVERFGNRDQQL